jgi:adenylate cyclase
VGVHGGRITLGRVGASRHHEYRMVGDAANTVSRIEALSKHLGTKLLVTEEVVAGLDDLLTRPLGSFLLAGKSAAVRIHELLGRNEEASPDQRRLCSAFAEALAAFHARHWDEAAARWSALLQSFPNDGASRFYLQRVPQFAAEAPAEGAAEWDGVVRMTSK